MLINQVPTDKVEDRTEEEILRVENQYWVDLAEALERLKANADFKKVVLEGYFKDKAINGVSLLATDHVRRNGVRGDVMEQLVAISHLEDYFYTITQMGSMPVEEESEE